MQKYTLQNHIEDHLNKKLDDIIDYEKIKKYDDNELQEYIKKYIDKLKQILEMKIIYTGLISDDSLEDTINSRFYNKTSIAFKGKTEFGLEDMPYNYLYIPPKKTPKKIVINSYFNLVKAELTNLGINEETIKTLLTPQN